MIFPIEFLYSSTEILVTITADGSGKVLKFEAEEISLDYLAVRCQGGALGGDFVFYTKWMPGNNAFQCILPRNDEGRNISYRENVIGNPIPILMNYCESDITFIQNQGGEHFVQIMFFGNGNKSVVLPKRVEDGTWLGEYDIPQAGGANSEARGYIGDYVIVTKSSEASYNAQQGGI